MKSALAFSLVAMAIAGSTTSAFCEEKVQTTVSGERAEVVDCSKQNWPNFSPTCLRNADLATAVRTVTADRR
jgi:hypothetical protein